MDAWASSKLCASERGSQSATPSAYPATVEDELRRELEICQRALDAGDSAHAAAHLSTAFALAPFDERVHAAFESVAQQASILELLPEDSFLGTHVVRAHALHRAGRLDEAVVSLAPVAEQMPALRFELVLTGWLVAARARGVTLGEAGSGWIARLLSAVEVSTVGFHRLRQGERALLAGYGELAEAAAASVTDDVAVSMVAGMLRRMGRCDEALDAVGERRHELCSIQKGLALRTKGEGAQAAEAFAAAAAAFAPDDRSCTIEQARSWFVAGDFDKASALLQPLLPSEDPETAQLAEACARSTGGNDRVAVLDAFCRAARQPDLETPRDATANAFRKSPTQPKPGGGGSLAVAGWESPSNRLLAALYLASTSDVTKVDYTLAQCELPFDPASSRRGSTLLWVVRDGVLVQGVPEPPVELRRAIAAVAREGGAFDDLWDEAAQLASTLELRRAPEIAAAMVHPPTDPDWLLTLPDGLFRYQVACACVLAALPEGWETTRPVFESLVFGPIDWSSSAAIIALGQLAQRDSRAARDALALLSEVVPDLLPHSCEPRFFPLSHALHSLPCVPRSLTETLAGWYRKHFGEPEETQEKPVDPRPSRSPWIWLPVVLLALLGAVVLGRAMLR